MCRQPHHQPPGAGEGERGESAQERAPWRDDARMLQLRLSQRLPARLHSGEGRFGRRLVVSSTMCGLQQSEGHELVLLLFIYLFTLKNFDLFLTCLLVFYLLFPWFLLVFLLGF